MLKNNKTISLIILIAIILIVIIAIQNPFKQTESIIGELQDNENTGLDIGNLAPDFILVPSLPMTPFPRFIGNVSSPTTISLTVDSTSIV